MGGKWENMRKCTVLYRGRKDWEKAGNKICVMSKAKTEDTANKSRKMEVQYVMIPMKLMEENYDKKCEVTIWIAWSHNIY